MSSGDFDIYRYEDDDGGIHGIKLQPETVAAVFNPGGTNAQATGTIDSKIRASATRKRTPTQLSARFVSCEWTTKPANYTGAGFRLVVCDPTVFSTIVSDQSTVTYLGGSGKVLTKSGELPTS